YQNGIIASRESETARHASSAGCRGRRPFVDETGQLREITSKIAVTADFEIAERIPTYIRRAFICGRWIEILLGPPFPPSKRGGTSIVVGSGGVRGLTGRE